MTQVVLVFTLLLTIMEYFITYVYTHESSQKNECMYVYNKKVAEDS